MDILGSNLQRRRRSWRALLMAALFATPVAATTAAYATDWYVKAPITSSETGKGTLASPFTTWATSIGSTKPGDTLHVLPGTYTTMMYISHSGNALIGGGYMNIVGDPSNRPKILVSGPNGISFNKGVSYVRISGFDIQTTGLNANGIFSITGSPVHHIIIDNNLIHDNSAAGISMVRADYLAITNNVIWNNAITSSTDCSGIDIYQPTNVDTLPGFHIVIRGNVVYNNSNSVPSPGQTNPTDGNGIIIDDSRHTQLGYLSTAPAYTGSTLIENNLSFNNGGRGIHVFLSDNVLIRYNTTYGNEWTPVFSGWGLAEIMAVNSGNVQVYNNIMYTLGPKFYAFEATGSTNVTADYNVYFNGPAALIKTTTGGTPWGSHNIFADPRFVKPGTSPATADFHVAAGSPARLFGVPNLGAADPGFDLPQAARPTASPTTVGAYQ